MRDFGGFLRGISWKRKNSWRKNSWRKKFLEKKKKFGGKIENFLAEKKETPQKLRIPVKNSGKKMKESVKFLEEKNSMEKQRIPRKKRKKSRKKCPEIENFRGKKGGKNLEKWGIYGIKISPWWNSWRKRNFHGKRKDFQKKKKNTKKSWRKCPEIENSKEKNLEKLRICGIKTSQCWNSWKKFLEEKNPGGRKKNLAEKRKIFGGETEISQRKRPRNWEFQEKTGGKNLEKTRNLWN